MKREIFNYSYTDIRNYKINIKRNVLYFIDKGSTSNEKEPLSCTFLHVNN